MITGISADGTDVRLTPDLADGPGHLMVTGAVFVVAGELGASGV